MSASNAVVEHQIRRIEAEAIALLKEKGKLEAIIADCEKIISQFSERKAEAQEVHRTTMIRLLEIRALRAELKAKLGNSGKGGKGAGASAGGTRRSSRRQKQRKTRRGHRN